MLGDRLVERILGEVCPVAADNAVEKLLTKPEVMQKFGVCHTTLHNWGQGWCTRPCEGRTQNPLSPWRCSGSA